MTETLAFLQEAEVVNVGQEWKHITHLFLALQHVNALILSAIAWDCLEQIQADGVDVIL